MYINTDTPTAMQATRACKPTKPKTAKVKQQ